MDKIKELENKQAALQEEINELKREKESKDYLPFCERITTGQTYFFCGMGDGETKEELFVNDSTDKANIKIGNFHETLEESERWVKRQEIDTKLRNIAKRLNKGEKIDLTNFHQKKYSICLARDMLLRGRLQISNCTRALATTNIMCLDTGMFEVAIEEIGEQELINHYEQYQE